MFDVDKRLKAILEGDVNKDAYDDNDDEFYPDGNNGSYMDWYDDDTNRGGENKKMMANELYTEAALLADLFMLESSIVGGDLFTESSFEGVTLAQLLREVTEKEIRDDVEKKRTRWQKFKEGFKRFLQAPFDPYGGLKELKVVNELIKDDTSVGVAAVLPFIGIFLIILNRAKKYKNFPEATAREYIAEAKKHREYLNQIASNLEKDDPAKYKKAVKRVRKQIKYLDAWMVEFERRAIDHAVL